MVRSPYATTFLRLGALLAALAVIAGAFGAHALEARLTPEQLDTYQTGARYHFYHALGLLLVAILLHWGRKPLLIWSGWLFLMGILFFSGSLYLLSLQEWLTFTWNWLGPITPLGGFLLILAWFALLGSTFQYRD